MTLMINDAVDDDPEDEVMRTRLAVHPITSLTTTTAMATTMMTMVKQDACRSIMTMSNYVTVIHLINTINLAIVTMIICTTIC